MLSLKNKLWTGSMQFRQSRRQVFGGRPKTSAKSQRSIEARETYE